MTIETILLQPDQALKLQKLHADVMYEDAADRGWCHTRVKMAQDKYKEYAESLGLKGGLRTDRIAMTIWYNYDVIYQKTMIDQHHSPVCKVIAINFDMDSDYLIKMDK